MSSPTDLFLLRSAYLQEVSILKRNDEAYAYAMAAEVMEKTCAGARKRRADADESIGTAGNSKRTRTDNGGVQANTLFVGYNGAMQDLLWSSGSSMFSRGTAVVGSST